MEEAVAADRAALAETTRERMPQKWATTQVNLGCTLLELGKRERGTAHLEEAVAALNACLADCPQDLAQFVRTHYDEAQAEIARRSTK